MGKANGSIKARVIRLTRLDECGKPVTGACSVIVSAGFTRVNAAAEYEDGEEFLVKNAWGDLCINEKDPDRLKRMNLTADFCAVHPDVADMMAGSVPVLDTKGDAVGFAVTEDVSEAHFMLELWSGVTGGSSCGAAGQGQAAAQLWHYWLYPAVKVGRIGDLTFEYGPLTFTIDASTVPVDAGWTFPHGSPPFPGTMPDKSHYLYVVTDVQPPAVSEGCTAYPAPAVPATGATAGTPGGWTPTGSAPPATFAALQAGSVVASPATAWGTGEYVQTGTSGTAGEAHWDGSAWVAGKA
jgi:hypothetical protein